MPSKLPSQTPGGNVIHDLTGDGEFILECIDPNSEKFKQINEGDEEDDSYDRDSIGDENEDDDERDSDSSRAKSLQEYYSDEQDGDEDDDD